MLRFADGVAIVAQDEINFKRALENVDDILKFNKKIKIIRKKTEVMVCCEEFGNINIKMDDNALTLLPKSKYIGSIFTTDRKNKEYIIH